MGFHHVRPFAEGVFNAEQLGLREFIFQRFHYLRVIHTIVIAGDNLLRLWRIEPVQVGFSRFFRAVGLHIFIDPRHRELRQDIHLRHDHFVAFFGVLVTDVIHFRFKANQHVTQAALDKRGGRAATAGVEHLNVFQELGHKLLGFGFIAAVGFIRRAPGRQIGIARVAGGFRVRENQLHVRAHQVIPVVNVFRVPFTDQERHGGVKRRAIVRQTRLPVGRDQIAFVMQDLNVSHLVISYNVCF